MSQEGFSSQQEAQVTRIVRMAMASFLGVFLYPILATGFLATQRHFRAVDVGLAFTCEAAAAVICGPAFGFLVDRAGAYRTMRVMHAFAPFAFASIFIAPNVPLVLLAGFCAGAVAEGCDVSRSTLVGVSFKGKDRKAVSARMRTKTNASFLAATIISALAFGHGPVGYDIGIAIVIAAGLYAWYATGALAPKEPEVAREAKVTSRETPALPQKSAWRDHRYLIMSFLASAMMLVMSVRMLTMPLYILDDTHMPKGFAGYAFIPGTLIAMLLQRRIAGKFHTLADARRAMLIAGPLCVGSLLLLAPIASASTDMAYVWLLFSTVLLGIGQTVLMSAIWIIRYELVPADHPGGTYQSVFLWSTAVLVVPASTASTALLQIAGADAWLLFAGFFTAVAIALTAGISWAGRNVADVQPSTVITA